MAGNTVDDPALAPQTPEEAEHKPWAKWWGNHLAEVRWQAEFARLVADPIWRGEGVERGNGMAVMTIPGFLAGDSSLGPMRSWLKRVGYKPYRSAISFNVDCSDLVTDRLSSKLQHLAEQNGPVALIGHSRGGHFAKALAVRHPDLVSSVISAGAGLDTPFAISRPTQAAVQVVREVHSRAENRVGNKGCMTESCTCQFAQDYASEFPPEVPLTSIYSRGDGVVWWRACLVDYADCVEVTGSHVGLAFNRKVYAVLAEKLATVAGK
ncbi:MAG: esterase/lipase family protein [Solirubrobacterales bacterium]